MTTWTLSTCGTFPVITTVLLAEANTSTLAVGTAF